MDTEDFATAKQARRTHVGQLTKLYNKLERNMITYDNVETVNNLFNKLCERFDQFKTTHFQCLETCAEPEAVADLESNYDSCQKNFVEFRERYLQWKAEMKSPEDNDNRSEVSCESVRTSVSSRSKFNSVKTKRLIEETRLKRLKEKLEMERARKELDIKQQIFEQECKVEEALIEESVWNAGDDTMETGGTENGPISGSDTVLTGNGTQSRVVSDSDNVGSATKSDSDKNCSNLNNCNRMHSDSDVFIHSKDQVGKSNLNISSDESSINLAFQRLASTLKEGFDLPKPELLTFRGNPIDYCKFVKNFETNIENRVDDASLRLSYLIQYCQGEAKSCIEDCVLLEPEEGYKRARSILYSRYGRPHIIVRNYVESLVYGPQVKASDIDSLSRLSLEMQKCEITLSQLGFVSDIDNTENLRRIVKRLPMHLRVKWAEFANNILESGREPRFKDLAGFVEGRARVASSMYGIDLAKESSVTKGGNRPGSSSNRQTLSDSRVTTLSFQGESVTRLQKPCCCCTGSCCDLAQCKKFKTMTLDERTKLVKRLKLCFNCLKGNHFSNKCRKPKSCTVSDCNVKHNILLHSWVSNRDDHATTHPSVNCAFTDGTKKNCLGIIPVAVKGENGVSCQTYALIDDGSDKTLCDERLLSKLQVGSRPVTFTISTVSSTGSKSHGQEVNLQVQAVDGGRIVNLRRVWSVKRLPVSTRSAATRSNIQHLPYLADIDIPSVNEDDVTLLIGTDSPDCHIPLEVRCGDSNQPYAIRTCLGWTVRGPVYDKLEPNFVNIHFQESKDLLLHEQLERMWNTDFNDKVRGEKMSMSVEDRRALSMMESSITLEDGHYKLGLPWREDRVELPNNITLAHARLDQLKRKLSRDSNLRQMYTATMNDYIEKGYAREVTEPETCSKAVWYLPHHPVVNVNKPGKVRIVFDCAAKYKETSLNSKLLRGPDLMNNLVGVIIRFRQERVAIAADVEAMFHQVRVLDEDRDALRFLWWPNGDIHDQPKLYCMQVHLFGATSSPSCTAFALKRTASDNATNFNAEVISTVNKNFYVDDCLKSFKSEKQAIELSSDLRSLLHLGGFRLTKWLSNSRAVLDTIPQSEKAPSVTCLMPDDALPSERALGVIWDTNDDKIKIKVSVASKPVTRRGILSIVSAIFDPLGLVSPVTLKAKAIVQRSFREKLQWDDPLPENMENEWQKWLATLPSLQNINVDRCYKPSGFGEVKSTQLHIFSDGSEQGYGACAYLRLTNTQNKHTCSLLMGKSRLAPMKRMTIPRLELSGAVVACRLYAFLEEELEEHVDQVIFWTDSTIVLGYIKNTSRRFKTFVGNRLSEIHDTTSPEQWRHVGTDSNPADIASRGIDASDEQGLKRWLYGPEFLRCETEHWPQQPLPKDTTEDDVEVKKQIAVYATSSDAIHKFMCHFSSWTRLVQSVAWLLRFKAYCKHRYLNNPKQCDTGQLTLVEFRKSVNAIVQHVQVTCFPDELTHLRNGQPVKKNSRLSSLNPVMFNDLIRVCGRLNVTDHSKLPIILPNDHHVTSLIIRHHHETQGHVGASQVLATTRQRYWIIKGPSSVKRVLKRCLPCIRQRGPLCTQQMAPLKIEQTTPDKPPFSYVGVDFFGPLTVRCGRSNPKRYGCLFTCLASRAIHIEIVHSLDTDSFISAFRRFSSRRGQPEKIFSDNGTNLVAGDKELRKSIQEFNQTKIGKFMLQREVEWHFNPPYASHMGGTWERLIRSTRVILKALTREQLLGDEQLLTLMAEAERIVNDRPITKIGNDPNDPPALTPNMLLLMRSNVCIPPGTFLKTDVYAKRWWRQVQYLADVFWKRWLREYLPPLQQRHKWQRERRDIRTDDIVLVADENLPRGQWPLGRVIEVNTGRDGHVRSCVVKLRKSQVVRPITKLCLLECSD